MNPSGVTAIFTLSIYDSQYRPGGSTKYEIHRSHEKSICI